MPNLVSHKKGRQFLLVWIFFHLAVNGLYIDVWRGANQMSRVSPAISMAKEGNMQIDAYAHMTVDKSLINGHYYSDKPPIPSFLLAPVLWCLNRVPAISNLPDDTYLNVALLVGNLLLGIFPFAGLVFLSFWVIRDRPYAPLISSLPFYGSFLFIGSGTAGAHLFSAFLALLAYLLIERDRYFWAGLCVSVIFGTEYQLLLFFALLGLVLLKKNPENWKNISGLLWGTLPGIGIVLWHNYGLTGDPFVFPYKYFAIREAAITEGYALRFPSFSSIFHLTLSDYRGVLIYAPFLSFFIWYYRKISLQKVYNHLLFWPMLIFFLYISSLYMWHGDWSVGARYLSSPVALCLFLGISHYYLRSFRQIQAKVFLIVGVLGVSLFFLIKGTVLYNFPGQYMHPLTEIFWPALMKGNWNNGNVVWFLFKEGSAIALVLLFVLFGMGLFMINRWYSQLLRELPQEGDSLSLSA